MWLNTLYKQGDLIAEEEERADAEEKFNNVDTLKRERINLMNFSVLFGNGVRRGHKRSSKEGVS